MTKPQPIRGNPEVANAFVTECVAKRPIEFNPNWVNESDGYFDRAVKGKHAPVLELGVQYHCVDKDGRNVMLIGTELGNVIVFQRTANNPNVIVAHASPVMNVFIEENIGEVSAIDSIEHLDFFMDIQTAFSKAPQERREALIAMHGPVIVDKEGTTMNNEKPEDKKTNAEAKVDNTAEATAKPADAPKANATGAEAPKAEEAKTEAPKEAKQTQSKTKEQDMKQANKTEAKPQLTSWGVFWRVSGLMVLCLAVVAAIVLGVYYGGAYLAGLGLSTITMQAINVLVAIVSGGVIVGAIIKTTEWIRDLFDRKAPSAPVAPRATAAA